MLLSTFSMRYNSKKKNSSVDGFFLKVEVFERKLN